MGERGGNRTLPARFDLQHLQRELLPLLRERPRRRGQSFALRKRLLERREAFAREQHARLEILALAQRGPRSSVGLVGGAAERFRGRPPRRVPGLDELELELRQQPLRRFVTDAQPLRRAAEREQSVAAAPRKQRLRLGAPAEDLVELARQPRLRGALDRRHTGPPLFGLDLQAGVLCRGRLCGMGGVACRSLEPK